MWHGVSLHAFLVMLLAVQFLIPPVWVKHGLDCLQRCRLAATTGAHCPLMYGVHNAKQGEPLAQAKLGIMYADGLGVPPNMTEALKWYRTAAEQGEPQAQVNLGFIYAQGQGVPQDYTKALQWFRLAANQGHARAQVNLGFMYYRGDGIPQDYAAAKKWFLAAAAHAGASRT
jgi:TPR repeat protein